ncbi:MobQ family relaxase [Bacillus cereus]|uniref:MobA/MobL protein domain-containing protein n=1 Tax=Bacillus cereus (strain VD146) TaxID=1053236 RepID=R8MCX3_BACCX|nr:MobQ family relaxase [Bacillus cereus]EOP32265.1 hypothetical protein IK1_05801 [Bacillus cereus VD146]
MTNISSLHFSVNLISRKDGRSTVACAAYRSDEKLYDERNEKHHKFKKHDVQPESFILAPSNAKEWVYDREKLWNEVEKVERNWNSQLSREVLIAIPNDLNHEQQRELVSEFVRKNFVDEGMIADVNIHRDKDHNPHAHIMLTMRPFDEDGNWMPKRKCIGEDENGKKIYGDNPWDHKDNVGMWRNVYQELVNETYERLNIDRRFDLRSYEKQRRDELPTSHMGHVFAGMEKRAQKNAIEKGNEYVPITKVAQVNQEIQKLNKEIEVCKKELSILENKQNVVSMEKKKEEFSQDTRKVLEKSGVWDSLSPSEKVSVMYVRKRMKVESVNLTDALECKQSIDRWKKSIETNENNLKSEIENLKKSKELYTEFTKAEPGTINHERCQIQLARLGFSTTNYQTEYQDKVKELQSENTSIKSQKEKFNEGITTVNQAIKILEKVSVQEAKIIYKDHEGLDKFNPLELSKLVKEFKQNGNIVPLENVKQFLSDLDKQVIKTQPTILEKYEKLNRDNYFVVNWKRKLDERTEAAEKIRLTNPVSYAKEMKEITTEQKALVERLRTIKVEKQILEKSMVSEVRKQYPNEKFMENIDFKTAKTILNLNQKENRIVSVEEIMERFNRNKQREEKLDPNPSVNNDNVSKENKPNFKQPGTEELVNEVAKGIKSIFDNSGIGEKSEMNKLMDEQKRKAEAEKRKNRGMSR